MDGDASALCEHKLKMSELVLIGGLDARHRDRVREFVFARIARFMPEPLSGLRGDPARCDPHPQRADAVRSISIR
jgi:hypothetical protein